MPTCDYDFGKPIMTIGRGHKNENSTFLCHYKKCRLDLDKKLYNLEHVSVK